MNLNYKVYGNGQSMIILHGLFGCGDNWNSIAKRLSDYFKVWVVDLRNHGHSPWSEEFSYELMAKDLYFFMIDKQIEKSIVMGHSMGGKTAMLFNHLFPEFVSKLIIVDMGIKAYPPHHKDIIAAIDSIDLSIVCNRREVQTKLQNQIDSEGLIQFLLKNIYWKKKGILAWRMNVKVLKEKMFEILKEIQISESFVNCLFITGELSDYVLESDKKNIEEIFPDITFIEIQNAGHWVHAENTEDFLNQILGFCLR